MQVQDVFKLLFHANGFRHSLDTHIFERLQKELAGLDYSIHDPLIEPVSDKFIRVNLRPYVLAGHSPKTLYNLMLNSSDNKEDFETLVSQWEQFLHLGYKAFPQEEIESFKFSDSPHHSELYKRLYAPAYRIVAKGSFDNAFPNI